ncbi:glycosyltransferase [Devosia nitrariae]|uniref:Glycosyl transferase family 1 domain-containing protein n=1 Tax=Devosia nitrariae TaxID=2071872 RepID=A0ABQ5W5S7_9HYPH|nr:glycosyltransferase [Devosia nitrariae]GLQ54970.1 hypothetical protein GCM10010862_22290 [Devosia nitrariae]
MTKPALAFIGHPFHTKTRSNNFFIEILKREFDVHVFYIEPDPRALMEEIANAGYELVVCWQTEFCAPYFLMRGLRVVCVPMFDGVERAPDWYWLTMRQARFISFSQELHRNLRRLNLESYSFRYYGHSVLEVPQAKFDGLRAFFWQRRPEEGVHYKFVRHLLGDVVDALHVHNAPDRAKPEDWEPDNAATVSHFNDDGSAYRQALEKANVFVCPRHTEGIGMSMIEALARGMCVVAHNKATANEYIVDGVNGLLIDFAQQPKFKSAPSAFTRKKELLLDVAIAERLGQKAREMYLAGYRAWLEDEPRIPLLVMSAPKADLDASDRNFADTYLSICKFAHRDFGRFLFELLRLRRRGLQGHEAASVTMADQIAWSLKRIPGAVITAKVGRRTLRVVRSIVRRLAE